MADKRAVIVGLGGIGTWTLQGLAPYLQYDEANSWSLVLIDGDEYEEKNRGRQVFDELGSKAEVQARWVTKKFTRLNVRPIAQYVSADGAGDTIPVKDAICSGDIVFSCLDNHKTRKMVADHCATLHDVALFSGGNEYTDGNVQFFIRMDGKDRTCRLDAHHPEIAEPKDKAPFEMSCEQLAASSPQLIFANAQAAVSMLSAFYAHEQKKLDWRKPEVYFDILQIAVVPRSRK